MEASTVIRTGIVVRMALAAVTLAASACDSSGDPVPAVDIEDPSSSTDLAEVALDAVESTDPGGLEDPGPDPLDSQEPADTTPETMDMSTGEDLPDGSPDEGSDDADAPVIEDTEEPLDAPPAETEDVVPIDACADVVCDNGGVCAVQEDFAICECLPGFEGSTCELNVDDCVGTPCVNDGTCVDGLESFECECAPGFTGALCEANIDDCAVMPCLNGGDCVDGVGAFACVCVSGYEGTLCETSIDDCTPNPCANGGSCIDGLNAFACECPAGFEGLTCETNIDECVGVVCENGGDCVDGANGFACECAPGFEGALCEIDVDECAVSPCKNGGTCSDGADAFACVCAKGFEGPTCEINIDDCTADSCLNNGKCIDGVNIFSCECPAGFIGATCFINVNECKSGPCENGGICFDGANAFTCQCAPGFDGPTCGHNVDDCALQPCDNGGTCVDGVNGYTCDCPAPFGGGDCQLVDCGQEPCAAGVCFSLQPGGLGECDCAPGTGGPLCADGPGVCTVKTCANGGQCFNVGDGPECDCPEGTAGPTCGIELAACGACQNGAGCVGGECQCKPGFSGSLCAVADCANVSCDDGNQCTEDLCEADACVHNVMVCDDGDACTADACVHDSGCQYDPVSCEDNNACTTNSCDKVLGCQIGFVACEDNEACTLNQCDADVGCVYPPLPCTDNDACTSDGCAGGDCTHAPVDCGDGIDCTVDTCDKVLGCQNLNAACEDDNDCTQNSCDEGGSCVYPPITCDDADACTVDTCDPNSGCVFTQAPVACQVTQWSDWTDCSAACEGGTHKRTRLIESHAKCGGEGCPPLVEIAPCNEQPCAVDCQVGPWSQWGDCAGPCDAGLQKRTRDVTVQPDAGGAVCPVLEQTQSCDTSGLSCDDGVVCTIADSCSGGACTGFPSDAECNDQDVCSKDTCSLSGCVNTQEPSDCQVSPWSAWSACSVLCGGGERTRNRTVTADATCGGANCPGLLQSQTCNTQLCPVDCEVSDWSPYSECSGPCDAGSRVRTRTVLTEPENGGQACGELSQTQTCSMDGKVCDDDVECTTGDKCTAGQCVATPTNAVCDDGDKCTDDVCGVSGCTNQPTICDDGDDCTTDTCDSKSGCKAAFVDSCPHELVMEHFMGTNSFFDIKGHAAIVGDVLRLTPDKVNQSGTIWLKEKVQITPGFVASFRFEFVAAVKSGADGMAFVIHDQGNKKTGGELGIGAGQLAVSLDSYGSGSTKKVTILEGTTAKASTNLSGDWSNSGPHQVGVILSGGKMTVLVDGVAVHSNVAVNVGAATDQDGRALLGFTARTGGESETHDVTELRFATECDAVACDDADPCTATGLCVVPKRSNKDCKGLKWNDGFGTKDVCAESDVPKCVSSATWSQALGTCNAVGARLCTLAEVLADETRGTGCQWDNSRTWTSSPCHNGGVWTAAGSSIYKNTYPVECTPISQAVATVRCCGDKSTLTAPVCVGRDGEDCVDGDACTVDSCQYQSGCDNTTVAPCAAAKDGACCSTNGNAGCSDKNCQTCVCDTLPACCTGSWSAACEAAANTTCWISCGCD